MKKTVIPGSYTGKPPFNRWVGNKTFGEIHAKDIRLCDPITKPFKPKKMPLFTLQRALIERKIMSK
jgi:hypothetical protein